MSKPKDEESLAALTRAVHGGEPRGYPHDALTPPIVQTATYSFADTAELVFTRTNGTWTAEVPKNEYAEGPITLLDIVLDGGKLSAPLSVSWRAKK